MKKVSFLVGAGCEGQGQLYLPSGRDFKRDTIVANQITILINAINPQGILSIRNGTILAHNSHSILYQTITEYPNIFSFSGQDEEVVKNYCQLVQKTKSYPDAEAEHIRKDFARIYTNLYKEIKNYNVANDLLSKNAQAFLIHACFYSFVDSLFNHLRKPDCYHNEISRVIKLYFAAYQSILTALLQNSGLSDEYNQMISGQQSIFDKRRRLGELISISQDIIFQKHATDGTLYYNVIRDLSKNPNLQLSILTTNYTDFAQKFTGISDSNVAYIHGKMNLFENVKTKQIGRIESFKSDEYIFPFIFVQSGVKPIINSFQINEFNKATQMIMDSDELFLIGYGINTDDEHISNLLRERLHNNRKITCFLYNNTDEERTNIQKELFYAGDKLVFCPSTQFKNILSAL